MILTKRSVTLKLTSIAVLLNLFSLYFFYRADLASNTGKEGLIASSIWIISIILFIISIFILYPSKKATKNPENTLDLAEKIFFILMLLFALTLRLYKLTHRGIYLDEWYWLTQAKSLLNGEINTPFGFVGDQPSNMPCYIIAMFLAPLKNVYLAVRLPSVLYSMLNILFIFMFLKEAFDKRVALISVLLLSTSIWDIHMSQTGWNNITPNPFLISGVILFMYRGIKYHSERDILISGLFLGISLNLLYVASLSLIITVIYFTYHLIICKKPTFFRSVLISSGLKFNTIKLSFNFSLEKSLFINFSNFSESLVPFKLSTVSFFYSDNAKNLNKTIFLLLLLGLTTFMTSSPTIIKIYNNSETAIGRHRSFINENINYSKDQGGLNYYINQIKLVINDFSYNQDKYKMYILWGITLEPVVIFFLLIGIVYSLRHIYAPHFLLICLSFFVMFIPMVVLYRTDSIWREYSFVPSIYMLTAIGFYVFSKLSAKSITIKILHYKPEVNLKTALLWLSIFIYSVSWMYHAAMYNHNFLLNESDSTEAYSKAITEYIDKNIPEGTLVLLPDELCKNYITIVLQDKYNYKTYVSLDDVMPYLIKKEKFVLVKMEFNITKANESDRSLLFFKKNLKKFDSSVQIENIITRYDGTHAVIFYCFHNSPGKLIR